jgi:hypothetical protein
MGKRKNPNLFELLGRRSAQPPTTEPRPSRKEATGWFASAKRWLGLFELQSKGQGRRTGSLKIVGVGLLMLVAGLGIGRLLSPKEPAQDRLRSERTPTPPGPMTLVKDLLLPGQETEALSKFFFLVVTSSAPRREEAAAAAAYLREHGIKSARIRQFTNRQTQQQLWLPVCYAPPGDDSFAAGERAKLLADLEAVPPLKSTKHWSVVPTLQQAVE